MRKSKGPKIDPCGTSVVTGSSSELYLQLISYWLRCINSEVTDQQGVVKSKWFLNSLHYQIYTLEAQLNIAKCTYIFFLKLLYNFLKNTCRTSLRSIKINI